MDFDKSPSSKDLPKILQKFKRHHLNSYVYLIYYQNQKACKVVKKKKIFFSYIINELLVQNILKGLNIEQVNQQTITTEEFNLTLAEPLGPSIKQLFVLCDYSFKTSTICQIGVKLVKFNYNYLYFNSLFKLKLVQKMHHRKILHTSLNPSKILTSIKDCSKNELFLSDFSKAYSSAFELRKPIRNGIELPKIRGDFNKINIFSGRNMLLAETPSFLDDLDSILYVLLYLFNGKSFIKGEIQDYKNLAYSSRIKAIQTFKILTSDEILCKKAPKAVLEFSTYIRGLKDDRSIDYNHLISLLMTLASKNPFEWKFLYKYEDLMKKYDPISLKQEKFKGLSPKNNKAPKQLELIEEEEVKEKKEKVFEKVNKLNQGSFEFKNSFMNNVEIGGSPTKKDYACFNDRNLNFSNMCGDRGI